MNHNEHPKYRCPTGTSAGGQKKSKAMRKSLPKALSVQEKFLKEAYSVLSDSLKVWLD